MIAPGSNTKLGHHCAPATLEVVSGGSVARIDRYPGAAVLQGARGRQTDGAAPQHGAVGAADRAGEVGGEFRRAPGQRDPAAAVAVVMYQQLAAERLGSQHEAAGSERPQANDAADDPVPLHDPPARAQRLARGLERRREAARLLTPCEQHGGGGGK